MGIFITYNDQKLGVGDVLRITQKISEKGKERLQVFEGTLIAIKGLQDKKTLTVRRIGAGKIGIEKIIPLNSPSVVKIEKVKEGTPGVRSAKLYYIRNKSQRDIDKIYSRASKKSKGKK